MIEKKLTVVVHSCDLYSDLWVPFFTLFRKYFPLNNLRVLLNTESVDFSIDGVNIECIHPQKPSDPYGKRMIQALNCVKTPYVLSLLDDFFVSAPVDLDHIEKIITWMDRDPSIVCFTQDLLKTEFDWERDKYPHYKRVPHGTPYTLNMQAGIWRTEKLKAYWRPNVSPWEWEGYSNCITYFRPKDKFYCMADTGVYFCYYGKEKVGDLFGVYRGKWIKEHVVPLFEKEQLFVDFSTRGFYDGTVAFNISEGGKSDTQLIRDCIDEKVLGKFVRFKFLHAKFLRSVNAPLLHSFLAYIGYRALRRDIRKRRISIICESLKKDGVWKTIRRIIKRKTR